MNVLPAVAAALSVLALALSGCGSEPGPGELVVRMGLPDGPVYMEGSTPVVTVTRDGGERVFSTPAPVSTLDEPVLRRTLRAGDYAVEVVQRPCNGNCSDLGPPDEATRCRVGVSISEAQTTTVDVSVRRSDGRAAADCSVR